MHVPLNALVFGGDKIDSRSKAGRGIDIDSLANSIAKLGLILPLAVIQEGDKYRVVDGNRRLEALKKIHKGDKDITIPVLVQDAHNGTAKMLSLAANAERLPLHPVDQYECFAAIAASGIPLDEIAASFGVGERQVRQQMALGSLSPLVRKLYRDGDLDIRTVKALTRVPVKEQEQLVTSGKQRWMIAQEIEQRFNNEALSPSSGVAEFVGLEAYLAAGGTIVPDLFAEEGKELWANPAIAHELANARLEMLALEVKADGWSFFERTEEYWGQDYMEEEPAGAPVAVTESDQKAIESIKGRMAEIDLELGKYQGEDMHPENNELVCEYQDLEAAENEILDQYRGWTTEQKDTLGVVIDAHWQIHYGVRRRAGGKPARVEGAAPEAAKEPEAASSAVVMELDAHLTVACKAALAADPPLAQRLLALHLLQHSMLFGLDTSYGGITIKQLGGESVLKQPDHRLDEIEGLLKAVKLTKAKDFEARVKAMEKISDEGIALIIAFFTARSLSTQHRGRDLVLYLDKTKRLHTAEHFTPDVENFFGRLTKAQLRMVATDMGVTDKQWKDNNWDMLKKSELAAAVCMVKPEGWLPEAMRPKKPE